MTEPILCPDCGHDIDEHRIGDWGADNCHECFDCPFGPSDIAHAYGEKCFHEGWDACELQWAVRHSE